jgi:hypothetical protein
VSAIAKKFISEEVTKALSRFRLPYDSPIRAELETTAVDCWRAQACGSSAGRGRSQPHARRADRATQARCAIFVLLPATSAEDFPK